MPEGIQANWSPSPGTSPLNTLLLGIERYVMAPDDPEAADLALEGINDGIKRVNTKRWCWSRTSDDITLTSATEYDLQSNFKSERSASVLDASDNVICVLRF